MGRSTAPQAITPAAAASRTSVKPTTSGSARRRSNPLKGTIVLNNNNNINIEGVYYVKQTGLFVGWYWKERWLSLKGTSLTVHTRKTKASPPAKEIPLSTIASVEPDPKRSNCLFLATRQKDTGLYILFPSDGDLYAWREAIYLRSGLSSDIGSPTDFVHAMHVSYDEKTGELKVCFTLLPWFLSTILSHWQVAGFDQIQVENADDVLFAAIVRQFIASASA
ncbi:hypothetical protein H1R20_g8534, partial [Candolleomyces eurysporus]